MQRAVQQRLGEKRARNERGDELRPLRIVKAWVGGHQVRGHRGVVEERQAARGVGIEKALLQQLRANGAQLRRAGLDERAHGGNALGQIGLFIQGHALHFGQGAAIAEDDI